MLGITGFWDFSGAENARNLSIRTSIITEPIGQRGPDDSGTGVETQGNLLMFQSQLDPNKRIL